MFRPADVTAGGHPLAAGDDPPDAVRIASEGPGEAFGAVDGLKSVPGPRLWPLCAAIVALVKGLP